MFEDVDDSDESSDDAPPAPDEQQPPAPDEQPPAPGAAAAAGKQQQQTTDDDEQPLVATPLWSTFAANIRRTKVEHLRRWCDLWQVDYKRYCNLETGDIVDVSGLKNTILKEVLPHCGEKHLYPPVIFGYGFGFLPRTVEEHAQHVESCADCLQTRRHYGRADKICIVHKFGAALVKEVDFSEYP
jgi:hypothetical protein